MSLLWAGDGKQFLFRDVQSLGAPMPEVDVGYYIDYFTYTLLLKYFLYLLHSYVTDDYILITVFFHPFSKCYPGECVRLKLYEIVLMVGPRLIDLNIFYNQPFMYRSQKKIRNKPLLC